MKIYENWSWIGIMLIWGSGLDITILRNQNRLHSCIILMMSGPINNVVTSLVIDE